MKNNKPIKTLVSLDYVELSEDKTLDLTLNNNKGIVEIMLDNEYEESDYEETSHMMKSSSSSLGDLLREEFVVNNDNEGVKGDWVLPIIQKDMIYKKFNFQLRSKYVCEMIKGDLEIKDYEYDVGELISLIGKTLLGITKIESIDIYIHVESVKV